MYAQNPLIIPLGATFGEIRRKKHSKVDCHRIFPFSHPAAFFVNEQKLFLFCYLDLSEHFQFCCEMCLFLPKESFKNHSTVCLLKPFQDRSAVFWFCPHPSGLVSSRRLGIHWQFPISARGRFSSCRIGKGQSVQNLNCLHPMNSKLVRVRSQLHCCPLSSSMCRTRSLFPSTSSRSVNSTSPVFSAQSIRIARGVLHVHCASEGRLRTHRLWGYVYMFFSCWIIYIWNI